MVINNFKNKLYRIGFDIYFLEILVHFNIVLDDIKVGSRLYTPESKLIESKDSVLLDQYGKIDE